MTEPPNDTTAARRYWQRNLRYVAILLSIWFLASYGCGILFKDVLDRVRIPGTGFKLGFWFAQQGFDRWMKLKERKRNGESPTGVFGIARNDRGAVGNGAKALTQRLDGIDAALVDAKQSREKLHDELKDVDRRVARIEGRQSA